MTTHPKFRVGGSWIFEEGSSGYAPNQPDRGTCAVREVKAERLRTRIPALHAAQAVLEHGDDGTAAGPHVPSSAAEPNGVLPMNRIGGFDAGQYQLDHEAIAL